MIVAIEGADKTGKSTLAASLAIDGSVRYNCTKEHYDIMKDKMSNSDEILVYDRVDWLTHMVYRLALPGYEWNDPRVRTVFTMPDAHLIIKIHTNRSASIARDELYNDPMSIHNINEMYKLVIESIERHIETMLVPPVRSLTVIGVDSDPEINRFTQSIVMFYSSAERLWLSSATLHDCTNEDIKKLLLAEERKHNDGSAM